MAILCLLLITGAVAQTPTAEQLEIFRNLTPEQQQALLEGMASPSQEGAAPHATGDRATINDVTQPIWNKCGGSKCRQW